MTRRPLFQCALASTALVVAGVAVWLALFHRPGDPRLKLFVTGKPPMPVVFTSRSDTSSFRAASELGDYLASSSATLCGSGQPQWQAREGRLRVLTQDGEVRELTWGKRLPDGGMLIDVLSPSVTADGKTVLFAGRREGGRFRIFSVNLDGSDLQQLTGDADDTGCVAMPPLRFAADGSKLTDDARKRADYDDVDPYLLPNGALVFASSRLPDLGGRDRRATQIWIREMNGTPRTLSASRSNDRWPVVSSNYAVLFSLWSRVDDVVSEDGTGLVRHSPPAPGLTAPTDRWANVQISPSAENFAYLVKVREPVWRGRPLFDGGLAFFTPAPGRPDPFTPANEHPEAGPLRVARAATGQVAAAPSSLGVGSEYPALEDAPVLWAPATTSDRRKWSLATPSALPDDRVLVAAAPLGPDGNPSPPAYGLYTLPQGGWSADPSVMGELLPLFDDPELVDGEPVAAYARSLPNSPIRMTNSWDAASVRSLTLLGGRNYSGQAAEVHIEQLTTAQTGQFVGQTPRGGDGRVVPFFAPGSITTISFYASHRDRFDHPEKPVVYGKLEPLLDAAATLVGDGSVRATLPVGAPTLLVGRGADGKVAKAIGAADSTGKKGTFYAYAGDHVSGVRAGGYTFCTGCHTGHTFTTGNHAERVK